MTVAVAGLLLVAPLMVIIALLIKATSPGAVIYRQPRVGLDRRRSRAPSGLSHRRSTDRGGRIFTIYKFRTMTVGECAGETWCKPGDARVTAIGRILRATRLDELPQFVNVIKGDMNIVGPRPEQPGIFDELRHELRGYRRRQRVLPGITGLAQITLGYDTDLDGVRRKVDLDLEYIRSRTPGRDLLIMAKTVPVMVFGKVWM